MQKDINIIIDNLIKEMTIEEKASLCSGEDTWNTQKIERLNIPSIMVSDGPHGLRKQLNTQDNLGIGESVKATCFPTASLLACSFDKDLIFEMGQAIADECISEGVSVILGPGINIKRSPLCGRNFEYFSEDPLVAGMLGAAYVDGVQSKGIGTSLKHFAVNNQERRRMNVNAEIDERTLREIYLRGFELVIKKASPYTVMCSYNKVNNTYASENKYLLTDILRNEWGYDGAVVSDWGATNSRVEGIKAGLDLEMPGNGGLNDKKIVEAVKTGRLEEEELNKSCKNVLKLAFKCQDRMTDSDGKRILQDKKELLNKNHELAIKIAKESMILLRNNNSILPIVNNENTKIAIIGPLAKNPRYQGAGSSKINPVKIDDPYNIFNDKHTNVLYSDGYSINSKTANNEPDLINKAIEISQSADYTVVFAGLPERCESEGFDRKDMSMPDNQNKLIDELSKHSKNIIVVLMGGASIEIPWADSVDAILLSYLGGEGLGNAIFDILFGNTCPSGKLAETWPLTHTDCLCDKYFPGDRLTVQYRESIFVGYRYFSTVNKPVRYAFGHGLSYTTFNYKDISTESENIIINHLCDNNKAIEFTVNISNDGNFDAKETVFLFASRMNSIEPSEKYKLIGFKKDLIYKGTNKDITICINFEDLGYYDKELKRYNIETGTYRIYAGRNINDLSIYYDLKVINNIEANIERQNIQSVYDIISSENDVDSIPDTDFERLCGVKLSKPALKPKRPFTMDNCLEDTSVTIIGKIILMLASKFMLSETADKEKDQDQMMLAVIKEMPFHSLWISSNGIISEKMMYSILDILNGKLLKGIFGVIKR